ncbi:unnamed protein product [Nyctereutes procyonoides]|uniref:Peptidyl-prolyl cis-trans isomerase n=1 Tax=Nyctereutes procyonoides TaxID=34880 RepID=A0A811Y299_NYCPR|nr:unnamed protein product [Nyctereutes procyonoides]
MVSPWAVSPSSCWQSSKYSKKFHALSTGEEGFGYKDFCFHRIILRFLCQDGDFTCHNSMWQNFILKHRSPGILFMENTGPNTNSSQFFICTSNTEWLDGRQVVFGKVKEGMNIVETINWFGTRNGKTSKKITIADYEQV